MDIAHPPGSTRRDEDVFADDIRRALAGTPRERLAELSAALWKSYDAGVIPADEAQRLAEEIEARKAVLPAPPAPRRAGSRARTPASVERRRRWAGGGWMPPDLACRFTLAEVAALSVIAAEIAQRGRCELPIGAVAGRAGCCETIVKRALREARRLGLLTVIERRVAAFRNLPNVISLASASWSTWVRFRARKLRQGSGGTFAPPPESSSFQSTANGSRAEPGLACRWAERTVTTLPGPRPPGRSGSPPPWRGQRGPVC